MERERLDKPTRTAEHSSLPSRLETKSHNGGKNSTLHFEAERKALLTKHVVLFMLWYFMWKIGCRFWCSIGICLSRDFPSKLWRARRESCRAAKNIFLSRKNVSQERLEKILSNAPSNLIFFRFSKRHFSREIFSHFLEALGPLPPHAAFFPAQTNKIWEKWLFGASWKYDE